MTTEPALERHPPARRRRGRPAAPPEKLEAAHAAARDRICDAAYALFDRGGIAAISMREIAKEIGVSQMMAYKYFATKDHLLQELRSRAFDQLESALRDATIGVEEPRAQLEAILVAYLRFGQRESRAYRLMFDYWLYDNPNRMIEDFGDAIRRQAGAWNILLAAVAADFETRQEAGDPLGVAHLIWAGLHGLVSLDVSRKLAFGRTFDELAPPMVRAILAGIP